MISASGTRVIWPLADDFRSSMEGLPGAINVSYQAGYANATGLPVAPIPTAPRAGANALVPTVRPATWRQWIKAAGYAWRVGFSAG